MSKDLLIINNYHKYKVSSKYQTENLFNDIKIAYS
jgi:hypothetical protein